MKVVSVCTVYPGPGSPVSGLFSQRRLAGLQTVADVRVIHLRPWFPLLRPCPAEWLASAPGEAPPTDRGRMFYFPGVLKGLDGWWLKRAALPLLRRLAAAGELDVIDAQFGYPEGVGCVLAGRVLRKPVIVTAHGAEPWLLAQGGWRAKRLRWALRQAAGVVCVSDSLRPVFLAAGVAPERLAVVYNAVDRGVFHPRPQAEARKRLGLPAGGRLIVSVGRFDFEKGHQVLVRAVRRLRTRVGDVRLAVVGGRDPQQFNHMDVVLAEAADLGAAVMLPGPEPPERVADWLNAADLFALATYHETRSCVILEAMACGVPVVTTPVGDNPALVDPPHRGLLAPPGDDERLAEALAAALSHEWDRAAIADWGKEYDWAAAGRATGRLLSARLATGG
jgi:glycosyltransferase involved in cell wall biosynthesis